MPSRIRLVEEDGLPIFSATKDSAGGSRNKQRRIPVGEITAANRTIRDMKRPHCWRKLTWRGEQAKDDYDAAAVSESWATTK